MAIRVLIAEDHPIVRSGIRLLLESEEDIVVAGEAANGREAVQMVRSSPPDLVMMDISMPELGGLEATRQIRKDHPFLPILVLTMHEDERYFFQLLNAGANGYVVKGAAPGDLVSAIRAVASGGVYLYPSLAKCLVDEYRSNPPSAITPEQSPLSKRELEVLQLTAQGLTARQVAKDLSISANTVERHRANIMNKLGLSNRAQLVRYALERNLLPHPGGES
ncbi:MAG: response regulator transcription factor [Armatimonadetes bacterium]|nr:response regulator transcription factor [Armatimonadota bacterium]